MTSAGRIVQRREAAVSAEHDRIVGDQQLVGDRIEEAAELGLLLPARARDGRRASR